jgi:MSHA biogenesis protein MshQ
VANPEVDAGVDAAGEPKPWLHPWARRRAVTLLASQIEAPSDGSLVDFPVLVSVTDPEIAAAALATGADVVFTGADGTTVLASELESFSTTSNELVAWVKVPDLSATTDTTLYVYYGNPSPPPQTPEAVWTADFLAVWHLQQDPGPGGAGEILDATSRNQDGTAGIQMAPTDLVPARTGRGLTFNGVDKFIDFAAMDVGNTFTISMWVELDAADNVRTLIASSASGLETNGFRFFINSVDTSDRKIIFETGNGNGNGQSASTAPDAIATDTFTHVAVVVDRADATALIFVDGDSVAIDTSIVNDFETTSDFEIARMENSLFFFSGTLDEIRVASTLRPPEWLRTAFNNQLQPGSFHMLGPEELEPAL